MAGNPQGSNSQAHGTNHLSLATRDNVDDDVVASVFVGFSGCTTGFHECVTGCDLHPK